MHLILTLIVGGIIGWLASLLMKTDDQMGVISNVLVGIVGSGSEAGSSPSWASPPTARWAA